MPRKLFFRLKDGFPRVKLCFCVLCVLTYLALIRVSGAKLWGLFVFFLCAAVYLYLPGRFWARVTGMEKVLPEFAVPLGVLLGTGFLAVLYCVSMRLGVLWLLRALPPVLGLLWLVLLRGAPQSPWKAARAVYADGGFLSRVTLWCVLSVLFALMVSVKNAHPAAAGEIVLTQDVMWNIGNANSFALGFPPQDIRFSMVRFSYHYLTELVFGALSIVSGIACYDIYVFYAGPLVLAALLCCLYALGICFYRGHRNKALLFTFAMFLFNCASLWTALTNGTGSFGNTNMMHLITNVNAQGTAAVFVSVFVILFTEMARRCFDVSWMYLTVFSGQFCTCVFCQRAGSGHCRLQLCGHNAVCTVPQTALEPGIDRVGWSSGGFPGGLPCDFFFRDKHQCSFRIQDVGSFRTAPVAACMDGRQRSGRCGMHGAGSGFACILYAAFSISTVFKRAL